ALQRERTALQEQANTARQTAEKSWQEQLAAAQRDFGSQYAEWQNHVSRQQADMEMLRRERDAARSAGETLQQQAASWQAERRSLLEQVEYARQSQADASASEQLRRERDQAQAELAQLRQQNEQRAQSWALEKRSLLAHHQEECRRLTEEFDQRL